ncbi:MAG: hypothetical protein KAQ63_00600 [Candidatus Moranbacteria bacterium]|nr:hypothetical protein [Candidatus Moranbacteria bacterium]
MKTILGGGEIEMKNEEQDLAGIFLMSSGAVKVEMIVLSPKEKREKVFKKKEFLNNLFVVYGKGEFWSKSDSFEGGAHRNSLEYYDSYVDGSLTNQVYIVENLSEEENLVLLILRIKKP